MDNPIRYQPPSAFPEIPEPAETAERPDSPRDPDAPSFREVFEKLGQRLDEGQTTMSRVLVGSARLDAAELLALQAGIYRYSEALELATKLVDKASNAVRTTLQSQ